MQGLILANRFRIELFKNSQSYFLSEFSENIISVLPPSLDFQYKEVLHTDYPKKVVTDVSYGNIQINLNILSLHLPRLLNKLEKEGFLNMKISMQTLDFKDKITLKCEGCKLISYKIDDFSHSSNDLMRVILTFSCTYYKI